MYAPFQIVFSCMLSLPGFQANVQPKVDKKLWCINYAKFKYVIWKLYLSF